MHTHFSFMQAVSVFISVLIIGTFWRLAYAHLMASSNPTAKYVGQAMAFQY